MNDPNVFGFQDGSSPPPPPPQPDPVNPMAQYKFSAEEMRVLQQCNTESFFQRSLPFGTVMGLGTLAAVQKGMFKPNPRFGAFPKVTMAVIMGYFLGKLSYQQACAEKLMALPGSYIGQLLRDRRDGKIGPPIPKPPPSSMLGANPSDIYSDAGPGSSLDLDDHRPIFSEDTYRNDDAPITGPDVQPPTPSLSYEDLRRKNRSEFSNSKQDPYRMEPSMAPIVTRPRAPSPPSASTNKYGDAME